jgi:hypothetical protein
LRCQGQFKESLTVLPTGIVWPYYSKRFEENGWTNPLSKVLATLPKLGRKRPKLYSGVFHYYLTFGWG